MTKFFLLILILLTLISCWDVGNDPQAQKKDRTLFYRYSSEDETDDPNYLEKHKSFEIDVADDERFKGHVYYTIFQEGKDDHLGLSLKGSYPKLMFCSKLQPDINKMVGQWLCQQEKFEEGKRVFERELLMTIFEDGRLVFHDYYN